MSSQHYIGNEWEVGGVKLSKEFGKGPVIIVQLQRTVYNEHLDEYSTRGVKFYEDEAMGSVVQSTGTEIAQYDDAGIDQVTLAKLQELAALVQQWCSENCYKKVED